MIKLKDLWPETRPTVPKDPHGWFLGSNAALIGSLIGPKTKCIIELGSWLGTSTRFMLDHAPNAKLYAVDTWLGGPDHQGPNGACNEKLPTLYETFLTNCWDYKNRLYPLRMTTLEGLDLIFSEGCNPSLIYIDADHSYDAVCKDIENSISLFPHAVIVGDDWGWGGDLPVQRAARDMAKKYNKNIHVEGGWAWRFTD